MSDLRTWMYELSEGTLLQPATQQARLAALQASPGPPAYSGYGLGIARLGEFLGHNGAIYGFSTFAMRRPQTDTTIVVVASDSRNDTGPTTTIAVNMISKLYPDQLS